MHSRVPVNQSGLSYTSTTRTVDEQSGRTTELTFRVWAKGANIKAELTPSAKNTTPGYFLSHDNGREVLFVQPNRQVYSKLNTEALHPPPQLHSQATDAVNAPARMKIFTSVKGGGRLLGFPVTRYKFHGSFPVPYGTDPKQSATAEVEGDIWTTRAINSSTCVGPNDQNPVCLFLQFAPANVQPETEVGGFPLKAEATIQLKAPNGTIHKIQVHSEVSQLNTSDFPESVFQLPDGFKEVKVTFPAVPAAARH
jgi:hypothetical protein